MWIIGLGGILVCGIYVYVEYMSYVKYKSVEYMSIWNISLCVL
jgi:hypothetical protein